LLQLALLGPTKRFHPNSGSRSIQWQALAQHIPAPRMAGVRPADTAEYNRTARPGAPPPACTCNAIWKSCGRMQNAERGVAASDCGGRRSAWGLAVRK
jgi:hypothetical protein